MTTQQQTSLGWWGTGLICVFLVFFSSLIVYPEVTDSNILTALRFSSVTTAFPFLLVFAFEPMKRINLTANIGHWAETNRRYLWLILTFSHFLHLYQIFLYYQLGQSCNLMVWAITAPLWLIMIVFSAVEIKSPQWIDSVGQTHKKTLFNLIYLVVLWYIWLIFTLAFGLGAIAGHILFYNVPALILFLAAAIIGGLMKWRWSIF